MTRLANNVDPDEIANHGSFSPSHLELHLKRYLFWSAGLKGLKYYLKNPKCGHFLVSYTLTGEATLSFVFPPF